MLDCRSKLEPNMKAYALLILLVVYNVGGYKTVEYFGRSKIHGGSVPTLLEQEIHTLDREDQWKPTLARKVVSGGTPDETQNNLVNQIYFYLYTRDNPTDGKRLYLDDAVGLNNSSFNVSKPTKIITHGFLNTVFNDAIILIRNAYLKHGDYNIIAIDWGKLVFQPYVSAADHVPIVSKFSAKFITFLRTQGLDLSTVTIVGHSLGAHVAGLTAHTIKNNTHELVHLVVALDPALPDFALSDPGQRVGRGDAKYVQVIHTNAGVFGYELAIGDIDFYPNGGATQPGCQKSINTCSHLRSYEYFAESINSELGFQAVKCDFYSNFIKGACNSNAKTLLGGANPDYDAKGVYFLNTNENPPFAKGRI